MRMIYLLGCCLMLLPSLVAQDLETLVHDKDIRYVAEVYTYYDLYQTQDTRRDSLMKDGWRHTPLKQLQPHPDSPAIGSIYDILMDKNKMLDVTLYYDPHLKTPMTVEDKEHAVDNIDTIAWFDPETCAEHLDVLVTERT